MHQHKARQSKSRNLRIDRAKYWTLSVPFQHPQKSDSAKKSKRDEQKTTEEKKKRNENVTAKKTVATTQNLRGEVKLGPTTQSATKN